MKKRFYITTPIYYVNASPHIGHSYTTIAADTLTRYMRSQLGEENVWFLTGTDEHGQKIQRAAEKANLTPQQFTDQIVIQFQQMWKTLGISYNDFIRTTESRHKKTVGAMLKLLYDKGQIYSAQYEGWYCTPCETFWTELQLVDKKCPDCKRPVEKLSETSYFFKLAEHQAWLVKYLKDHPHFIKPASRYEEVVRFLELNTLSDLCISRPRERLGWGIPLPFSADHVTYVWFDALINYISAVGEFDEKGIYHSQWWPADIQLIGKDILRQHAVYWPIMLHACGIELPRAVFAHGWWLIADDKMSKSLGNVVSPLEMVKKFGLDVYRYFLLRDVPFGVDGNFSEEAIIQRFNGDLANDLGNLLYRTLTMVEKYFEGFVPQRQGLVIDEYGKRIEEKIQNLPEEVASFLTVAGGLDFGSALGKIWELIGMANKYVEETKPWNLVKENKPEQLKAFICVLVSAIRAVGEALYPFMPATAQSIRDQIGADKILKGNPLFPRIEILKK